jgi:hypothetical protein
MLLHLLPGLWLAFYCFIYKERAWYAQRDGDVLLSGDNGRNDMTQGAGSWPDVSLTASLRRCKSTTMPRVAMIKLQPSGSLHRLLVYGHFTPSREGNCIFGTLVHHLTVMW